MEHGYDLLQTPFFSYVFPLPDKGSGGVPSNALEAAGLLLKQFVVRLQVAAALLGVRVLQAWWRLPPTLSSGLTRGNLMHHTSCILTVSAA